MPNMQAKSWNQDKPIKIKIKKKNQSLIPNKSNIKGLIWKKNQYKKD
jgi:hypothetical protein